MASKTTNGTELKRGNILRTLDGPAQECNFPVLNNAHDYFGCVRLTAFLAPAEWIVAFEQVAFFVPDCSFQLFIYGFGNKLLKQGLQTNTIEVFLPAPHAPWYGDDGRFRLNPEDFAIAIRGRSRRFRPSANDYRAAGVALRSKMPAPAKILRYLCHACRDELRLTDEELLQACGREKSGLRKFVQVEEYYHPDLGGGELPGSTETFRSLAAALEANDTKLFVPRESNTHWRLWPDEPF